MVESSSATQAKYDADLSYNASTNTLTVPNITGNAATATTLLTARTLTIGSTGKTFNGGANVSWSLADIGAAASSHNHNASAITGGNFRNLIFTSSLATNETSDFIGGSLSGVEYTTLIIYATQSGSTDTRIMFPINLAGISNSTTRIYRFIWNNGSGTFANNLTITKSSAGNFTIANSAGNGPWNYNVFAYVRI